MMHLEHVVIGQRSSSLVIEVTRQYVTSLKPLGEQSALLR